MNKDLVAIFEYMEREKGIKREVIVSAIEDSLLTAARKSIHEYDNLEVTIDPKTGQIDVYCQKEIVAKVEDPDVEISLEEAEEINSDCEIGDFITVVVTPKDFGRIAAQTARQVITQKLRGAERDVIYEEYRHRVNEIISGSVKKFHKGANLIIDLGKVEAILPAKNYPKTEKYRIGDKVLALLLEVRDTENGGAEIVLTRSHPEFVYHLFKQEVPEIEEGTIIIDRIVREAGYRTKMTVRSTDSKVDPVGACVGMRGARVKNVVREINNEKIDIIPFSEDPVELLQNALAPIEIRKISVDASLDENCPLISIVVDDADYAIVVGKKGMNTSLNAELIGCELELQKMSDYYKAMAVQRAELASMNHPCLDETYHLEEINKLIVENLYEAGYKTCRQILEAGPEDLAQVAGVSFELADRIHSQVTGYVLGQTKN